MGRCAGEHVTLHGSELVLHLNYITLLHINVVRDYVQAIYFVVSAYGNGLSSLVSNASVVLRSTSHGESRFALSAKLAGLSVVFPTRAGV